MYRVVCFMRAWHTPPVFKKEMLSAQFHQENTPRIVCMYSSIGVSAASPGCSGVYSYDAHARLGDARVTLWLFPVAMILYDMR